MTKAQKILLQMVGDRDVVGCAIYITDAQELVAIGLCEWLKEPASQRNLLAITDAGRAALTKATTP